MLYVSELLHIKYAKNKNRLGKQEINFVAQSTFDKRVNQVDTSGGMVFIFYFWNTELYTCNRQSPQKGFRPIISIVSKKKYDDRITSYLPCTWEAEGCNTVHNIQCLCKIFRGNISVGGLTIRIMWELLFSPIPFILNA